MKSISFETSELLLRIAFLIGAFTDLLAILPLLFRSVGSFFSGSKVAAGRSIDYSRGVGASLMAGWTLLLAWGSLMPMERRDLLIITVVPVIAGIVLATIKATQSRNLKRNRAVPLLIHLSLVSLFYIFAYFTSVQALR